MRAALPLVFRIICGMSLELLYKALIVSHGEQVAYKHELLELAHAAGVEVGPGDEPLLQILSEAIKWDGRYPVPKKRATLEELYELEREHLVDWRQGAGKFVVGRANHALSWDGFNRLWNAAAARYESP